MNVSNDINRTLHKQTSRFPFEQLTGRAADRHQLGREHGRRQVRQVIHRVAENLQKFCGDLFGGRFCNSFGIGGKFVEDSSGQQAAAAADELGFVAARGSDEAAVRVHV